MDIYRTEEEQIEYLKAWGKKYGKTVIFSVAFALVVIFGGRYWQQQHEQYAIQASTGYQVLLQERALGQNDIAKTQANFLKQNYAKTPYAGFSGLFLAKILIEENKLSEAEKELHGVLDSSTDKTVRQIARIRYARLLISQNKNQDALKLLETIDNPSYKMLIEESKGDAYFAEKNIPKALTAYRAAVKSALPGVTPTPLLKMKLQDLETNTIEKEL